MFFLETCGYVEDKGILTYQKKKAMNSLKWLLISLEERLKQSLTCFSYAFHSNMQMTLSSVYNASAEIAAAANYPDIRVMGVAMIENDWFEQVDLSGV